jgi:hypothetical protein
MCSIRLYLATCVLIASTIGVLAQFTGTNQITATNQTVKARSTLVSGGVDQIVNRTHKTDRLPLSNKHPSDVSSSRLAPAPSQPIAVGCDPAFSPLSALARLNYPIRCMANNEIAPTNLLVAFRLIT